MSKGVHGPSEPLPRSRNSENFLSPAASRRPPPPAAPSPPPHRPARCCARGPPAPPAPAGRQPRPVAATPARPSAPGDLGQAGRAPPPCEPFRDHHGPVRGGRALESGERVVDHACGEDVPDLVPVPEPGVGVVRGVPLVLGGDRGELGLGRTAFPCVRGRRRRRSARWAGRERSRAGRPWRRSAGPRAAAKSPAPAPSPGAPFRIRSKPSASTRSQPPPSTSWRAGIRAVAPVAQLMLTLQTGAPVRPSSQTARRPAVEGWRQ